MWKRVCLQDTKMVATDSAEMEVMVYAEKDKTVSVSRDKSMSGRATH